MSGGKGGSTTSKTEIPAWMEDAAKYSLGRAKIADKIGYQPYYGPDVAAFSPMQEQAFQGTMDAASAFGLAPQGQQYTNPMASAKRDFGGVQGYSSGPMFDQAVAEYERQRPAQAAQYNQLFVQERQAPSSVPDFTGGNPYMPTQNSGIYGYNHFAPSGAANIPRAQEGSSQVMPAMQQFQGYQAPTPSMPVPSIPAPDYTKYFNAPMDTSFTAPQAAAKPKKLSGAKARRRADLARR